MWCFDMKRDIIHNPFFVATFFFLFVIINIFLVYGATRNTESRSKALGDDPYDVILPSGSRCVIADNSVSNSCNHCEYGISGDEAAFSGQARVCAGKPPKLPGGSTCVIADGSRADSCNYCRYGVAGDDAAYDGQIRSCERFTTAIENAINRFLESNGIGYGIELKCATGQQKFGNDKGLTWCY